MTLRACITSVLVIVAAVAVVPLSPVALAKGDESGISVRETGGGTYAVAARFTVPASPRTVREVLTDYANIPRFAPGVRRSEVVERQEGRVRVEQEAISSFVWFSKRVHLLLDVEEQDGIIRFRDRSGESFVVYEGAWTMTERGGGTELGYELTARPAFSVPGFVLRRLLNRDSTEMIARLSAEIVSRGRATH